MKLTTLVIAAALAAGCTVRNDERSFLVGTKIIAATKNPDATATNCLYNPATAETVFGAFDPAFGYVHAVVVENRLPANGTGPGRINTNDFQVEGATVTTDVLLGPAQSIGAQTVPANGLIKAGVLGAPVSVVLAQPGAIAPGSTVRFNVQCTPTRHSYEQFRDNWLLCERLGFDVAYSTDHFVSGQPENSVLEGPTTLSAMAST